MSLSRDNHRGFLIAYRYSFRVLTRNNRAILNLSFRHTILWLKGKFMHKSILLVAALTAFAANSFFCRFALANHAIDPGSFTWLRLVSGAVTLWFILVFRGQMNYHFVRDKASWWGWGSAVWLCRKLFIRLHPAHYRDRRVNSIWNGSDGFDCFPFNDR